MKLPRPLALFLLLPALALAEAAPATRQVLNLNPDWRFLRDDAPDAVKPGFNDSAWQRVSLPHTWNDVDTFDDFGTGGHTGEMNLWTGVAWYRKTFTLPRSAAGQRVVIEFEGVRQLAEVYLNGQRLGGNATGFIPFGFDLTPFLKFGEPNVLVVRADNRFQPYGEGPTPWHHPNWHPPHGGIYRNVRLHLLDPIHVTLPLYADLQTEGIYARTTSLTQEKAEVTITAEIENSTATAAAGRITFSIVDRDGRVLATDRRVTAGPPVAIEMKAITAPGGWRADGSDIALVDFEVVDAHGRRCPTDQGRVDFELSGPAIWRGGYNSGTENSTNHLYVSTECGINRVSLRSVRQAGTVTLTARRAGLKSAPLRLVSQPVKLDGGLLRQAPANSAQELGPRPVIDAVALAALTEARDRPTPVAATLANDERHFSTFAYTGLGAGGVEEPLYVNALAYSDDALLYIDQLPPALEGARLIRTANADRAYWANDYMVATAGQEIDFFVAHDAKIPRPGWLQDYQPTGANVTVNKRPLALYQRRLKKDDVLRIPGNADQGVPVGSAPNLVMFSRVVQK